ncbi:MAG: hypothetical protein ACD_21C00279G0001 [uncultured bacterium]|nr:MAG: hypothetical protein ACD_21C00279G0001 [uncultured bacterium]OGT08442.1 MAG: RNA chaperone Hfq [Gammaproteobacteria bacterium RBG_16_37_9]
MLKKQTLFDDFLRGLLEENADVSIFLINGVRLQGWLDAFDDQVIILKGDLMQLVFRHAVSTVVPNKNVAIPELSKGARV